MGRQYVNPTICAHRHVSVRKISQANKIYAYCQTCGLQGCPVPIGRFNFWSKSRATREFYKLANTIDKR